LDRAEAIQQLQAAGFTANERTWGPGETIFVGALPEEGRIITAWRVAIYLIPLEENAWGILDWENMRDPVVARFASLEEAVPAAIHHMRSRVAVYSLEPSRTGP